MNGPRIEVIKFVDDGHPEAADYANNYVFVRPQVRKPNGQEVLRKMLKRCLTWARRMLRSRARRRPTQAPAVSY